MDLNPQTQKLLDQLHAGDGPPMWEMTPEEARPGVDFFTEISGVPEDVAKVENRTIPGPNGDVPIRIYTPEGEGPFPALMYFHGGGWVCGHIEVTDVTCRMLCNRVPCVVVAVDYRLAPEHKYPAANEDSYAATKWVSDNAASLNVDPDKIAVGGDSAGGNMSAVISLMARDKKEFKIAYQLLIYPVTNLSYDTDSYREMAEGYQLGYEDMVWFFNHYLDDPDAQASDPYVSPLRAEDLSDLPPALVITGYYDPLRDEGEAYAMRLIEAGVKVEVKRYLDMMHGFFWVPGYIDVGRESVELAATALRTALYDK